MSKAVVRAVLAVCLVVQLPVLAWLWLPTHLLNFGDDAFAFAALASVILWAVSLTLKPWWRITASLGVIVALLGRLAWIDVVPDFQIVNIGPQSFLINSGMTTETWWDYTSFPLPLLTLALLGVFGVAGIVIASVFIPVKDAPMGAIEKEVVNVTLNDSNGGVPAGWYPDPEGKPAQRYWDGANWTDATRPNAGLPTAAVAGPATGATGLPQNGMGTAALILGIAGFFCLPLISSVLAIVFGRIGMTRADQGLATNRGSAKAGFILGIIGLALGAVGLIIWIVALASSPSYY